MILCFLNVVDGRPEALKILQTRLDTIFNFCAPRSWNAVVRVNTLRLLLQRTVKESDVDCIASFGAGMRRSEGDMTFRMPVLRRGNEWPLVIVKQIVNLWQNGRRTWTSKRPVDEVVLDVDQEQRSVLV